MMTASLVLTAVLAGQTLPNQPVASVDFARYAGTWHEIARIEQWFQRKCTGEVTATYTQRADGRITVDNRCRARSGEMTQARGVARRAGKAGGALEVRFAPDWLAWVPAVWADYWVIDLGQRYEWALIGSPSRDYLWILARDPKLDEATLADVLERARARGYDVNRLIRSNRSTVPLPAPVRQPGNASSTADPR